MFNTKMKTLMSLVLSIMLILSFQPTVNAKQKKSDEIRHIILFIGDGMHLEHERATSRYLYGEDFSLIWHKPNIFKYRVPVATWDVSTYDDYANFLGKPTYNPLSIDPTVGYNVVLGGKWPYPFDKKINDDYFLDPRFATDSASAGTAISTGYKTDDGNIAWLPGDPNDGKLKTITEMLREHKKFSIGVVSTVPFSHATPAVFVSHNKSRNNYAQIANEIVKETKPEVVIGGGHPGWSGSRYMSIALYNELKTNTYPEYIFVERKSEQDGAINLKSAAEQAKKNGKKLFGLFGGTGGNFEPPIPSDTPGYPSVSRATIENPLLKDATLSALEVLSQNKNGFFLMVEQGDIDWANHANNYRWMIGSTWDLEEAVKAAIEFVNRPGDHIDWSNTVLIVTSDHGNSYMRLNENNLPQKGDLPTQIGRDYNWQYPEGQVTYRTTSHTNELTMLYAMGDKINKIFKKYEGEWYPCSRIIDNTHIFNVLAESTGLDARSPLRVVIEKPSFCSEEYNWPEYEISISLN